MSDRVKTVDMSDPSVVLDCYRKLNVAYKELKAENEKLAQLSAKASQEASLLRAALKPFAKACEIYWPATPDEYRFSDDELLVVSDLRAAAAALKETGDE